MTLFIQQTDGGWEWKWVGEDGQVLEDDYSYPSVVDAFAAAYAAYQKEV